VFACLQLPRRGKERYLVVEGVSIPEVVSYFQESRINTQRNITDLGIYGSRQRLNIAYIEMNAGMR